ncbi:MAG: hypothetical protein ACK559_40265, partial [bacterium]
MRGRPAPLRLTPEQRRERRRDLVKRRLEQRRERPGVRGVHEEPSSAWLGVHRGEGLGRVGLLEG